MTYNHSVKTGFQKKVWFSSYGGKNGDKNGFFTLFSDFRLFFSRTTPMIFRLLCIQFKGMVDNYLAKTGCQKKFWFLSYGGKNRGKMAFLPHF